MQNAQLLLEEEAGSEWWTRARHAFRRCIPEGREHVDLMHFEREGNIPTATVIKDLLDTGKGKFVIKTDDLSRFPIGFWKQENRVQERTLGHYPLKLGFPMFATRDGDQLIFAPVFIWELRMEYPQSGRLILAHDTTDPVACNHWLMAYLSGRLENDMVEKLRLLPGQGNLTASSLIREMQSLSRALEFNPLSDHPALAPCPSEEDLSGIVGPGSIHWGGTVGIFPPDDPVDLELSREKLTGGPTRPMDGHSFGLFDLSPDQATAFHAIRENALTVIDGPSGSGKTHLAIHLLTNALANGKRMLIVSPRLESLREIHSRLASQGLDPLGFLAELDRKGIFPLLERLPEMAKDLEAARGENDQGFVTVLERCEREKQKLDEAYEALRRPVFGKYNWADTVGLFLKSNRREGRELLAAHLNAQDYRFTYDEYSALREAIIQSRPLYLMVNTLRHPLDGLHPDIFLDRDQEPAKAFFHQQLEMFLKKCSALQKQYINKINDYADQLTRFYEAWCDGFIARTGELSEKITEYISRYGKDYELTSMTSLKLYGSFIPKYRVMLRAKEEVFAGYDQIVNDFRKDSQFDFAFVPSGEGRMLPKMKACLDDLLDALYQWREDIPVLVREELSRLSNKTAHPSLHFSGHIQELEDSLDLLLAELNRSAIYEAPFSNRMLTLQKRRKYLEGVIEQLENSRLYLKDFDRYFPWQKQWLELSEPAQKVVRALIKVKPKDWVAAFESWYLNNCLVKAYVPALPAREFGLRQYVYNYDLLQSKLTPYIRHRWMNDQIRLLRETKRKDRRTFQKLFKLKKPSVSADQSHEELTSADLKTITEFMPVWLLPPKVARDLALPADTFDYLWVDEAHLLTPEQLAGVLRTGKRVIVSGDAQHASLGPGRSFFAESQTGKAFLCKFRYIHQWRPGDALRLINPIRVAHRAIGGFEVRLEQVDGKYDESTGTNEEEALRVIQLLSEIAPLSLQNPPSMAIAAFTREQRDLITAHLSKVKEKQLAGADLVARLEQHGLGVYYLDELMGYHPEVLIISGTFGLPDQKEELPDRFEMLNTPEGESLLSLTMCRSVNRLYIVNSIPWEVIEHYSGDFERRGTFLLANYFKYIYALERSDAATQQLIIQKLRNHFPTLEITHPPSIFIREVALALQSYLASERIHPNAQDAHLLLPLKIDPAADQVFPHVLLPDGYFGDAPVNDYRWEFRQRAYYAELRYHVLSTWSVNWWKNAQQESRKVASQILEYNDRDKEPDEPL